MSNGSASVIAVHVLEYLEQRSLSHPDRNPARPVGSEGRDDRGISPSEEGEDADRALQVETGVVVRLAFVRDEDLPAIGGEDHLIRRWADSQCRAELGAGRCVEEADCSWQGGASGFRFVQRFGQRGRLGVHRPGPMADYLGQLGDPILR